MLNAKDWVVDVSDHVGAALLVLAISGFSVTIAWSLLDLGRAGAIVGGLVLLALVIGEGAYQAWRDIAVQVAADDAGDDPRDQLREALTDLPRVRRIIRRSENPSVQALEPAIEAANDWRGACEPFYGLSRLT